MVNFFSCFSQRDGSLSINCMIQIRLLWQCVCCVVNWSVIEALIYDSYVLVFNSGTYRFSSFDMVLKSYVTFDIVKAIILLNLSNSLRKTAKQ